MRRYLLLPASVTLAWLLVLVPVAPLGACCMVPATYAGTIGQSAQEAVVMYRDGREELILRINYHIAPNDGSTLPDRFTWIITLPTEPDSYHLADDGVFADMFAWTDPLIQPPQDKSRGIPASAPNPRGVELGQRTQVGPYDIQPVRARGLAALDALNEWLVANGFTAETREHLAYFVENQFTFLAVKVVPEKDVSVVGSGGPLPPLHVSFASAKAYYPLKFSSRQGVFDLNIYMLTGTPLDYAADADVLARIAYVPGFTMNVPVTSSEFPKTLQKSYDLSFHGVQGASWYLNVLRTHQVNQDQSIATWKDDLFF